MLIIGIVLVLGIVFFVSRRKHTCTCNGVTTPAQPAASGALQAIFGASPTPTANAAV